MKDWQRSFLGGLFIGSFGICHWFFGYRKFGSSFAVQPVMRQSRSKSEKRSLYQNYRPIYQKRFSGLATMIHQKHLTFSLQQHRLFRTACL